MLRDRVGRDLERGGKGRFRATEERMRTAGEWQRDWERERRRRETRTLREKEKSEQ